MCTIQPERTISLVQDPNCLTRMLILCVVGSDRIFTAATSASRLNFLECL